MTLRKNYGVLLLLVLFLSAGFVFSATEKPITTNSSGSALPAGLSATASVEGVIKLQNGSTCYVDFYANSLPSCAQTAGSSVKGVKVWPGSYIDYTVRITNNSDSVILLNNPYNGLARFGIVAVSNQDDGPYSFNYNSGVDDGSGKITGDCTLDRHVLEKTQSATGKCRTIISEYIPYHNTQYFFGDLVFPSDSFGEIRISTQRAGSYNSNRLLFPQTSSSTFPDIDRFDGITYDFSSPSMPVNITFETDSYNGSAEELRNAFTEIKMNVSAQARNGPPNNPSNHSSCSFTKNSSSDYRFTCTNVPNDSFNDWSSPQRILPAAWDYIQYLMWQRTPVNATTYQGAPSLTGGSIIFQMGYYGQSRRWHPEPHVHPQLRDKAVNLSFVRANQGGSIYLNRSENLPIQVGFVAHQRNNNHNGGETTPVLTPNQVPSAAFKMRTYFIPVNVYWLDYLASNAAPFHEETFSASKASGQSGASFNYDFTIPAATLQTLSAGRYQVVMALVDSRYPNNNEQGLITAVGSLSDVIRILQPADDPFWSDTAVYDRLFDDVAHPLGLRNLFLTNSTIQIQPQGPNAANVKLFETTTGYCNLPYPALQNSLSFTLNGRDTSGSVPAPNKWVCILATTPGTYPIRATLTNGSAVITETLEIQAHAKTNLAWLSTAPSATEWNFETDDNPIVVTRNWFGSANGGTADSDLGTLEGGTSTKRVNRIVASAYVCANATDTTCSTPATTQVNRISYLPPTFNPIPTPLTNRTLFTTVNMIQFGTRNDTSQFTVNVPIHVNDAGRYKIVFELCDESGSCFSESVTRFLNVTEAYVAPSCQDTGEYDLSNATACTTSLPPASAPIVLRQACLPGSVIGGPDYCAYQCNPGYSFDSVQKKCVLNSCVNSPGFDLTNTRACTEINQSPNAPNLPYTLGTDCPTSGTHYCAHECESGWRLNASGTGCEPDPGRCDNPPSPGNLTYCGSDTPPSGGANYFYVDSCSNPAYSGTYCKFTCFNGYTFDPFTNRCIREDAAGWACDIQRVGGLPLTQDIIARNTPQPYEVTCRFNGTTQTCPVSPNWSTSIGEVSPASGMSTTLSSNAAGEGILRTSGGTGSNAFACEVAITVQAEGRDIVRVSELRMNEIMVDDATNLATVNGSFRLEFLNASATLVDQYRIELLDEEGQVAQTTTVTDEETCMVGTNSGPYPLSRDGCGLFSFVDVPAREYFQIRIVVNGAQMVDGSGNPTGIYETVLANNTQTTPRFYVAPIQTFSVPELPPWMGVLLVFILAGLFWTAKTKQD